VQLFAWIRKIFGKELPLTTLFQAPTIEQLAGILRQEDWSSPWSSLVPIKHGGSKPPFFSVHGCTGRVLHFYDLARLLGPEQPFFGLSALGLEKGQVPHTQFEDMAAHYIKEIRTIQFDGPYFIGGSGDGCGIAMEMAHQLASQGQNIGLLVLFSPTPLKPIISSTKLYTYRRSLRRFFFLLNNLLKKRPLIPAIINAFLTRVLWHWRIFHRYLPRHIFRWRRFIAAFNRARFSYTPRAYQGRITCFLSDEFSLNHKKLIPDWYKLDAGGIDIRFVPGTINTMWQEPHVQILAEQLKACLEEAQKDSEEFIDTKN
jgi:thioesterase domain-containing protein